MATGRQVAVAFLALTIAGVLFSPFASVVNTTAGEQTVTNESTVVDYNATQDLDGYRIVDGTSTVEWYNTTSDSWESVPTSQYDLHKENGSISWYSGSEVPDGADARVSYDYQSTSGATTTIVNLLPLFLALLLLGTAASKIQEMM